MFFFHITKYEMSNHSTRHVGVPEKGGPWLRKTFKIPETIQTKAWIKFH